MMVDVLVIGGGIHGAGVAQAAAAKGYSVCLLEQNDLAAGTSSRSSKLIHGGLRYLESGQWRLVRECLFERSLLLKNAPELVQLKPFFIPVYKHTSRRPLTLSLGLAAYGLLTGWNKAARFKRVARSDWDALDGLSQQNLQAVLQYWDAQTDDALLTRAVMHSAIELGAELIMPARFQGAQWQTDHWEVNYQQGDVQKNCQARVIVNAAGPWANQVLEKFQPAAKPCAVELVQGTHLVMDGEISKGIYYVEAPQDQRAVFVMPWYGKTLLGTTEKIYHGDPAQVAPTQQEVDYLLTVLQHYFPSHSQVVEQSFAGLRVLPASDSAAFSRPRETVFHREPVNKPRLLSIFGGKLTAYRATAEQAVNYLSPSLPAKKARADTRNLKLSKT